MLQELRESVKAASDLVTEVEARFRSGDPAEGLLQALAGCVSDIERRLAGAGQTVPDELRAGLAQLLSRFQTAVTTGGSWLARSEADGLELASQHLQLRVRRAYGVPARSD